MNLARALSQVPRVIRTTPGLQAIPEPQPVREPMRQKTLKQRPVGMVEAAAISWYIGQISHAPISWAAVARWVEQQHGMTYHRESIRHAVMRHGIPRKNKARRLPEDIMRACMQYVIVLRLHGYGQPWLEVRDELYKRHKINETNRSLSNVVMGWAGLRGPRSHKRAER
jgi:hypothetical protein